MAQFLLITSIEQILELARARAMAMARALLFIDFAF